MRLIGPLLGFDLFESFLGLFEFDRIRFACVYLDEIEWKIRRRRRARGSRKISIWIELELEELDKR